MSTRASWKVVQIVGLLLVRLATWIAQVPRYHCHAPTCRGFTTTGIASAAPRLTRGAADPRDLELPTADGVTDRALRYLTELEADVSGLDR